ncbi:MAG: valine--tRNA ligase [Candidatus Freyarchaeota archaeon]
MDTQEFKERIEEKRWSIDYEFEMIELWKKENWWRFDIKKPGKVFVIDTPPPYPAPMWHIGAALGYTYQDMIARSRRMLGYNVHYPIGMDRNGLPIEIYLERHENLEIWKVGREEFEKTCRKYLDKWTEQMKNIMTRMELMGDYDENCYTTDSPEYRAFTQRTFKELWDRGLIYEDERPNNWCPHCRTTVSDAEIEYRDERDKLYYVTFRLEDGNDLVISTTRPELIGACRAIIVHPDDERYKNIVGKTVVVPIYGERVKVYSHKEADPHFGTGAVMICSYGDFADVRVIRELQLTPVGLIDPKGVMTEKAGKYGGLTVGEARKKIVEDLRREGLLVKEEDITHSVPIHDKCGNIAEILPMHEYYLKQLEFRDALMSFTEKMRWHPPRYEHHLKNWLESLATDWPISRRRYYATEIPLWRCGSCGHIHVEGSRYVKPWKESPGIKCPKCGADDWEGETRVLDTWVDSSVSVLFITRYLRDPEFFEKTFTNGEKLRPQGYDIIRTWLYYTLLRVYQLRGVPAFDHVFINGMGLDERGKKMSKSRGNIIDPEEMLDKYGADALRMWICTECTVGENYNISEKKIAAEQRFLTKLWNIARFISKFPAAERPEALQPTDEWILSELNNLIEKAKESYEDFNFNWVARNVKNFLWNVFASHYIEMVKRRATMDGFTENEAQSAWFTLHTALQKSLLLLAPIIPAITDKLWRTLYSDTSIHSMPFPQKTEQIGDATHKTKTIMDFNSSVWTEKKKRGLKLSSPIQGIKIPEELQEYAKDLEATHKLE